MFCSKCGAENTESASSCGQCGAALLSNAVSNQDQRDHDTDTDFVTEISSPLYRGKDWTKVFAVISILVGVGIIVATPLPKILAILIACIPIWAGVLLYQSVSRLEQAHRSGDKELLRSSLNKLNTYFHFLGVTTTVVVGVVFLFLVAVPDPVGRRQVGNESGAVSNLRTINTAQVMYVSSNGSYGDLAALSAAGLIDNRFSGDLVTVEGYTFVMPGVGTDSYVAVAIASGTGGRYSFYSGPDGVVRYRDAVFGESLPEGRSPGDPVQ